MKEHGKILEAIKSSRGNLRSISPFNQLTDSSVPSSGRRTKTETRFEDYQGLSKSELQKIPEMRVQGKASPGKNAAVKPPFERTQQLGAAFHQASMTMT